MALNRSLVSYSLVFLSIIGFTPKLAAQETGSITKKQVLKYMKRDLEALIEYKCTSDDKKDCKVACSSAGNNYIKAENANSAFHFERRSGFDRSVIGYVLVVDVSGGSNKDVWATLQVESSCAFFGMTPVIQ